MGSRPSLLKISFYLFTKYLVFFIVLGFLDSRFKTLIIENATTKYELFSNIIGYLIEVLFATVIMIIVLIIPVYFLFKINKTIYIILTFLILIVYEYFSYEYMCSYVHFDVAGIVNCIISIIFFPLFFGKFMLSFGYNKTA